MLFFKKKPSNKVFGVILVSIVTFMFLFAYANVPLFKLFCQRFGLGNSGKAATRGWTADVSSVTQDVLDRDIKVKFFGVAASGLPVRFGPSVDAVHVHPGKPVHLEYTFVNMSDDSVYFRAVHSIAPEEAAREFQLIQCFCFEDQTLGPRETRKLPVYFSLSPRTPTNVNEILLSYTLFPRDPDRPLPVSAEAAN
ncbi:MAG: cytochrome c oxidase assembly protein [Hyphomicrobiales bacterium]